MYFGNAYNCMEKKSSHIMGFYFMFSYMTFLENTIYSHLSFRHF